MGPPLRHPRGAPPGARRYIVCRNPIEAKQDAADRAALLTKLRQTLAHDGPKAMVGNRGYARFLKIAKGGVTLDEAAIRPRGQAGWQVRAHHQHRSARCRGGPGLSLWRVERAFRMLKSTLDVRPIFHQRADSVLGHIVGCFLALRLEVDLQRWLDAKGLAAPWPDLMRDLARLQADRRSRRHPLPLAHRLPRPHRQGLPGRRRRHTDRGHRARPRP